MPKYSGFLCAFHIMQALSKRPSLFMVHVYFIRNSWQGGNTIKLKLNKNTDHLELKDFNICCWFDMEQVS